MEGPCSVFAFLSFVYLSSLCWPHSRCSPSGHPMATPGRRFTSNHLRQRARLVFRRHRSGMHMVLTSSRIKAPARRSGLWMPTTTQTSKPIWLFLTRLSAFPCTTNNGCFQKMYAGGVKPRANAGWALEIALDVEWAHAIAPQARILLVEAASNSFSD